MTQPEIGNSAAFGIDHKRRNCGRKRITRRFARGEIGNSIAAIVQEDQTRQHDAFKFIGAPEDDFIGIEAQFLRGQADVAD